MAEQSSSVISIIPSRWQYCFLLSSQRSQKNLAVLGEQCGLIKGCLVTLCSPLKNYRKTKSACVQRITVYWAESQEFIMPDKLDCFFDRAIRSVDNRNVKLQMQSILILVKCLIVSHEIFHPELIEIGFGVNFLLFPGCQKRLLI